MKYIVEASACLKMEFGIEAESPTQAHSRVRDILKSKKDLWRMFLDMGAGTLVVHRETIREEKPIGEPQDHQQSVRFDSAPEPASSVS